MAQKRVMSITRIPFKLASYHAFGKFCPSVSKSERGYSIRILKSNGFNFRTGSETITYDYFETDLDGLVLSSPRGNAKIYNKKIKFIDLDEQIKKEMDEHENRG